MIPEQMKYGTEGLINEDECKSPEYRQGEMKTKIKIEYKFVLGDSYPYKAFTWLDQSYIHESSRVSFENAKELLIRKFADMIKEVPTIIPEPEEVEI